MCHFPLFEQSLSFHHMLQPFRDSSRCLFFCIFVVVGSFVCMTGKKERFAVQPIRLFQQSNLHSSKRFTKSMPLYGTKCIHNHGSQLVPEYAMRKKTQIGAEKPNKSSKHTQFIIGFMFEKSLFYAIETLPTFYHKHSLRGCGAFVKMHKNYLSRSQ